MYLFWRAMKKVYRVALHCLKLAQNWGFSLTQAKFEYIYIRKKYFHFHVHPSFCTLCFRYLFCKLYFWLLLILITLDRAFWNQDMNTPPVNHQNRPPSPAPRPTTNLPGALQPPPAAPVPSQGPHAPSEAVGTSPPPQGFPRMLHHIYTQILGK